MEQVLEMTGTRGILTNEFYVFASYEDLSLTSTQKAAEVLK